jgi:hypothetical protein
MSEPETDVLGHAWHFLQTWGEIHHGVEGLVRNYTRKRREQARDRFVEATAGLYPNRKTDDQSLLNQAREIVDGVYLS